MTQLSFDQFIDGLRSLVRPKSTAPYVRGSETSRAAAKQIEKHLSRIAAYVLAHIRSHIDLTCDEFEAITEMKHQTASARFRELADRCQVCGGWIESKKVRHRCSCRVPRPFIVRSGAKRPTRTGSNAWAWRAA